MINIQTILYRDNDGALKLWACRGEGKGCKRNKIRTHAKPCDDCLGPLPEDWTLQQVHDRMTRGDA